jgi:hypothetical protein
MGVDAYQTEKEEDAEHRREKEGDADWRNRLDWYSSQQGPVNSAPSYDTRRA